MRIFFLIFILAYVGGNVSYLSVLSHRFGMAGIYLVYDFCFIDSRCDEVVCTIAESRFLLCVGSYLLSAYPADYLCEDLLSE